MSYSVEERKMKYNTDIRGLRDLVSRIGRVNYVGLDDFNLELYEDEDGLRYKVVESDGPIVDLFGSYVDLDNGYVLLGDKSNVYIPYFNLYDYLEGKSNPVIIDKESLINIVERLKLGIYDNIEELNKQYYDNLKVKKNFKRSIIYSFLDDNKGELEEEDIKEKGVLNNIFKTLVNFDNDLPFMELNKAEENIVYIRKLMRSSEVEEGNKLINDVIDGINRREKFVWLDTVLNELSEDEDIEDVYLFDNRLIDYVIKKIVEETQLSYEAIMGRLDKKSVTTEEFLLDGEEELLIKAIDSLKERGRKMKAIWRNTWELIKEEINNIEEEELKLLNLYDMLEGYGDDRFVGLEVILNEGKLEIDNKQLRKVIDKIGVKEYLDGVSLKKVKDKIKGVHDKERVNKLINTYEKESISYKNVNFGGLDEVIKGLKKRNKFYRKVLKDIDKKLR